MAERGERREEERVEDKEDIEEDKELESEGEEVLGISGEEKAEWQGKKPHSCVTPQDHVGGLFKKDSEREWERYEWRGGEEERSLEESEGEGGKATERGQSAHKKFIRLALRMVKEFIITCSSLDRKAEEFSFTLALDWS